MKKSTTAERLNLLMKDRNLRQADILEAAKPFCEKYDVKLGRNDISQYVSGKIEPGQQKLTILGMALNVSEAWLMGYEVASSREPAPIGDEAQKRLDEFNMLFSQLSPEQMSYIISSIKGLLANK